MKSLARVRSLGGLIVITLALVPLGTAEGQVAKTKDTKDVTIPTADGAELSGTLYPNPGGKRDATVLLLHDFDLKKGGGSQKEGWSDLAKALHADGYVVMSFDFRGFGESKTVNKESFWKYKHNQLVKKKKTGETIDYTSFGPSYVINLVNDVAAAKAYLDRENDRKSCNTSSLIVIGAGEGATLGAMWMFNEGRRRKDKNPNPLLVGGVPMLSDQPESRDIACGVWLSLAARPGSRLIPLNKWVYEAGKTHKTPMLMLYGKSDSVGGNLAMNLEKAIKPKGDKKELPLTYSHGIAGTKSVGSKLIDREVIGGIRKYLDQVMEARGSKEWAERKVESSGFWYTNLKGLPIKINKRPNELVPGVDVDFLINAK